MQAKTLAGAARWLTITLLSFASAPAAVITSISGPITGSGAIGSTISGTNVSLNESVTSFSVNDGFATVIGLLSPPGATTYAVTKTITNNTGSNWSNYFVGVGCDTNANTPTVPRGSVDCYGSGLSLGITGSPGTSAGSVNSVNGGSFAVGGINIAPGQSLTLTFNLLTCPNCTGGDVMFQYANLSNAPEPATTALVGGALVALSLLRRLRKQA